MTDRDLLEADRRHWIHPVVNYRAHEQRGATVLDSARGSFLIDGDGVELLDAFAGLWCVNVGYGQESVVEAAAAQMRKLPYATGYFHYGSEPAIRLAQKLVSIAPKSLTRVYFGAGGGDAIDTAIRLVTNYYNVTGRPSKKHFIALERGYHGSMAVGSGLTALAPFHAGFDVPLATQHHLPSPYPYRHPAGPDPQAIIAASVKSLRDKVAELGADHVAAFFCEPVQGSGGVVMPPVGWLKAMREACRELDILFLADEVITGFGRTGPMFACLAEGVEPDLMTVAKGLTAGYVPMGATLVSEPIYQALADGIKAGMPMGHGHTYSAHPVAAAVALEVLRLYEEGGILANARRVAPAFEAGLAATLAHPLVGDVRARGLLGAIELVADKATKRRFDPSLRLPERIAEIAYKRRIVFRCFGDNILGFAPALNYSEADVALMLERVRLVLDDVLALEEVRAALAPARVAAVAAAG